MSRPRSTWHLFASGLLAALLAASVAALAGMWAGCDLSGSEPKEEGDPSLPPGPALVAVMAGEPGIWVFDPETLEPTPAFETRGPELDGIAFSPDAKRWYTSWSTGSFREGTGRNVIAALDPTSGRVTQQVSMPAPQEFRYPLVYDPINDQVVVSSVADTLRFYDAETLELAHERAVVDSNETVVDAVVAEGREKIYFGVNVEGPPQIVVYDSAERAIADSIRLPSFPPRISDVALSPDERYLYVTTWSSLGAPGRFFMVDLDRGEIVFDGGPVGKKANLVGRLPWVLPM